MTDDIGELESRMLKLKQDGERAGRKGNVLKKDREYLLGQNKYLIEKLREASIVYGEASKRILDFVDTQLKPLRAKMEDFESHYRMVKEYDKSITASADKIDNYQRMIVQMDSRLSQLGKLQASLEGSLKALDRRGNVIDKKLLSLDVTKGDFEDIESKIFTMQDAFNSRISSIQSQLESVASSLSKSMEAERAKKHAEMERTIKEFIIVKTQAEQTVLSMKREMEKFSVAKDRMEDQIIAKSVEGVEDKIRKLINSFEERQKKTDSGLNFLRNEMEERSRELRGETAKSAEAIKAELNKVDWKKGSDIDRAVTGLVNDMNYVKTDFSKSLDTLRKDVDRLGAKRQEMTEKVLKGLEKDMKERVLGLSEDFEERLRVLEEQEQKLRKSIEKNLEDYREGMKSTFLQEKKSLERQMTVSQKNTELTGQKLNDELSKRMSSIEGSIESMKGKINTVSEKLRKDFQASEAKRLNDADKVTKEFLVVKGSIEQRIGQLEEMIGNLDDIRASIKGEIIKSSLAGVEAKVKSMNKGLEERLTVSEAGAAKMKSELKTEMNAVSSGLSSSIAGLKTQMDRLDVSKSREIGKEIKSINRDLVAIKSDLGSVDMKKAIELNRAVKDVSAQMLAMKDSFSKSISSLQRDSERMDARNQKFTDAVVTRVEQEVFSKLEASRQDFERKSKEAMGSIERRMAMIDKNIQKRIATAEAASEEMKASLAAEISSVSASLSSSVAEIKKQLDRLDVSKSREIGKEMKAMGRDLAAIKSDLGSVDMKKAIELNSALKDVSARMLAMKEGFGKSITALQRGSERMDARNQKFTDAVVSRVEKELFSKLGASEEDFGKKSKELLTNVDSQLAASGKSVAATEKRLQSRVDSVAKKMESITSERAGYADRVVKEFVSAKGGIDRRIAELDGEIAKLSDIKTAIRDEIERETRLMVAERLKEQSSGIDTKSKSVEASIARLSASIDRISNELSLMKEKGKGSDKQIVLVKREIEALKKGSEYLDELIEKAEK